MAHKKWNAEQVKKFWAYRLAPPPLGSKLTCKIANGAWATRWSSKDYAEMERTPAPDPK